MSTGSQWRRPWVLIGGSVVAVSIATLIFPTVAIWLGVAVLMVCIGTVIHTAIRDTDLGPKQKAVLSFIERWSRRIMRLDRPGVDTALRIGVCAVAGIGLIASGGAVNAYRAEQQQQAKVKAAQLAADELQAKLQAETDAAEKANRRANAFLNDALTHLDLGDVASARKAIADSRAVPGADTEGLAAEISAKISQATDPTRLQAGLVELPDAAFEDAKAGRLPPQMATGHPGLDQRAAKVMATVLAGAVRQRENRRLAAIDSERRKKEEAVLAAKAENERRLKEQRDAEAARLKAETERLQAARRAEEEYDADGLVLLKSSLVGTYREFTFEITGTVENRRPRRVSYAQITFAIADESGAQVGTALANIADLAAGGRWNFKAVAFTSGRRYRLSKLFGY
jgi:hypothetical protein